MVSHYPGRLIVIEGLDRAGKSTQCSRLFRTLEQNGRNVEMIKFPDRGTPMGQIIDKYLTDNTMNLSDQAIHLLFSANRWEQVPHIIDKLKKGTVLIVDRYMYSGIAFSAAKGLDFNWCKSPDVGLPEPDLVIFLDVSIETASKRGGYGEERYENAEIQSRVRSQFLKLKESNWLWIDANKSLDEVEAEVNNEVQKVLNNSTQNR
ncbi:bifunctional thymidylate/uridylate kinase [Starmerella bacillaris]|uniref:Thymidylate kinase n=1 Tax=Starmerella bacillaris TaxID=1247836 RepID=A0AAV5RLJ0_STABA|nr:bifunctional thymidylate/uridylate kinase [Starmerella bacillaris]